MRGFLEIVLYLDTFIYSFSYQAKTKELQMKRMTYVTLILFALTLGQLSAEIGWCGNIWPNSGSSHPNGQGITVYFQMWKDGVTNTPGQGENLSASLYYRISGSAEYIAIDMPYFGEVGNNDEYSTTIPNEVFAAGDTVEFLCEAYDASDETYAYGSDQNGSGPFTFEAPGNYIIINETIQDVAVTFQVNMELLEPVEQAYVAGSFNGWNATATPMSDDNDDMIWEATVTIPSGSNPGQEYKFINGADWESVSNRSFIVDDSQTTQELPVVWFNDQEPSDEFATVTFILDASSVSSYTGFNLKGSWDAAGFFDSSWNNGEEHTPFYNDGTHGDTIPNDDQWAAQMELVPDDGANQWQWGVTDQDHYWINGNFAFTVQDTTSQTLFYQLESTCSIVGYVYDNNNSAPIAGATVTIGGETATTEESGGFAIRLVPPGVYDLQVTADGYVTYLSEDHSFPEGNLFLQIGLTAVGEIQPPINLSAIENDAQIVLNWDVPPVRELLGYNVYRDAQQINEGLVTETTFTDNAVANFTTYIYYVTAMYTQGESAPSATIQATPHPETVLLPSIVGDFNNWDPANPDFLLVLNDNGVWTLTIELQAGTYDYKATETNDWTADFPTANQSFTLDTDQSVTFMANLGATAGVREGDEFVTHANPVVVGSFISELGGVDWDPADLTGEMVDSNDDGIFEWGAVIPEGTWEFKITLNHNWDQATTSNNIGFVSDGISETQITYDMATNAIETNAITPPAASITFTIDDSGIEYFEGYYLLGTWDTETGMFDPNWDGGAEHTPFYDDGTHGDATANDHIFTVTVDLISDGGSNTWEWGFNDQNHVWLFGNFEFSVADSAAQTLSYIIPTTGTVNGTVTNSITEEPLVGATVQLIGGSTTQTDDSGHYSIEATVGTYTMICSFVNYGTQTIDGFNVPFNAAVTQDFELVRELHAPINLAAEEGNQQVTLTWEMPGATSRRNNSASRSRDLIGYKVYRDDESVATLGLVDPLEYIDTGLTNNQTYTYYVTANYEEGESLPSNSVDATPHTMSGSASDMIPTQTALLGNHPNPFNPETTIRFALAHDSRVRIDIVNVRGQIVRTVLDDPVKAGYHSTAWDGTDQTGKSAASGVYFTRITADGKQQLKKIVLIK